MTFEKCMKNSFTEIGVAPQYNTPAWKVCKYVWETAYSAGVQAERERCAEVAEKQEKQLPSSCHMRDFHAEGYNDACEDIAAAIRGQIND